MHPSNLHSVFLAKVTHEFRTPLASLNASVEYLLDEIDHMSMDETRDLLKSIHLSVTGLQTMIDNLLESSTMEAGTFVIRPENISIDTFVDEAIRVMSPLLTRRGQCVQIHRPQFLPMVFGDETRLTQVLVNLLSNASKYGPLEQIIDVNIEYNHDDIVKLSVLDRGPGISAEIRSNLFERFINTRSKDGPQYGFGLGLSVVKVIVQEHGGSVGVFDRSGGGSDFWFTVPCVKEET